MRVDPDKMNVCDVVFGSVFHDTVKAPTDGTLGGFVRAISVFVQPFVITDDGKSTRTLVDGSLNR